MAANPNAKSTVSALQMAWLRELGIEKPWLPELAATRHIAAVDTELHHPVVPSTTRVHVKPVEATPKRPALVSLDTITALNEAVAQCQACGLCHEREQVVVGAGDLQPDLMIIGEAPADQEDRQGIPFVGRPGELLDNMLRAIGWDRASRVYLTNAIKCRPPGNRSPRPEELAACRPFLVQQIALLRPKKLLVLGRFAAHSLLGGDESLQSLREKSMTYRSDGLEIPVVVTYNPSYVLRRPEEKASVWFDLQRLL